MSTRLFYWKKNPKSQKAYNEHKNQEVIQLFPRNIYTCSANDSIQG